MDALGRAPLCDVCWACDCAESGDSPECRRCIVDGARGVYVPQAFAKNFDLSAWGVSSDLGDILIWHGPDREEYWEAWDDVLRVATFKDEKGRTWNLEQDGDLFAYCATVPFDSSLHTDDETETEEGSNE